MKKKHTKKDCNCPYGIKPKYVSRAHWICPICGRDVSLEYVLLSEVKNLTTN